MRYVLLLLISLNFAYGAKVVEVGERFEDSKKCKSCHLRVVNEWEESWHSKSHYENDEYFKASIDYVSQKTRKSLNGVKVQCATCHNSRISVTSTGSDYEIASIMGLAKGSKVDKAVNSDNISEGVNCVVCHNIDKIHNEYDDSKLGINRVEWTESGAMTGPYKDAFSPYHKTISHEFMSEKPNDLCFVCHANDRSVKGLVFSDMKNEYQDEKKSCVECHMGPQRKGIAASYRTNEGKTVERMVRSHGFAGAHIDSLWKGALKLELSQKDDNVLIEISNPQAHNIPSGFGSREIVVDVVSKNGDAVLETKSISLTRYYTRRNGKPTIAHLAEEESKDLSIPANGKKILKVPTLHGTTAVEVTLSYRLVNDEVISLLKLKDLIWSEKKYIAKESLKVKSSF